MFLRSGTSRIKISRSSLKVKQLSLILVLPNLIVLSSLMNLTVDTVPVNVSVFIVKKFKVRRILVLEGFETRIHDQHTYIRCFCLYLLVSQNQLPIQDLLYARCILFLKIFFCFPDIYFIFETVQMVCFEHILFSYVNFSSPIYIRFNQNLYLFFVYREICSAVVFFLKHRLGLVPSQVMSFKNGL